MTFHLLYQPKIYARLMKDLEGIDPTNLKWAQLEQRPYLWALVQESLRHQPGVVGRSARIAREEDLFYKSQDSEDAICNPVRHACEHDSRDQPLGHAAVSRPRRVRP